MLVLFSMTHNNHVVLLDLIHSSAGDFILENCITNDELAVGLEYIKDHHPNVFAVGQLKQLHKRIYTCLNNEIIFLCESFFH